MSFATAFEKTIINEGGFTNNSADRGKATRYGITEAVARANGYKGEMRYLPMDVARAIYMDKYWDTLRLDDVSVVAMPLADKLFDIGVNMGIGTAAKFLQRALNVLGKSPVSVDGQLGSGTVKALTDFIHWRGDAGLKALMKFIAGQQAVRYIEICEKDAVQKTFIMGWGARV